MFYFNNKNAIAVMTINQSNAMDWASIMFNVHEESFKGGHYTNIDVARDRYSCVHQGCL
jgi:hypothetical protein